MMPSWPIQVKGLLLDPVCVTVSPKGAMPYESVIAPASLVSSVVEPIASK
jgi:hypothetical protein